MRTLGQPVRWAAGIALGAAACADTLGLAGVFGAGTVTLRTDRTEYVATYVSGEGAYRQYGFTVVARLENRGPERVYLARCYPDSPHPIYGVELVDQDGDSWGSGYSGAWACVGHDRQIPVAAGESRTDTLRLRGPNAWDGRTKQPFGALAGRMRLVYGVQTCPGDGECRLDREVGRANVFTVEQVP